MSAAFHAKKRKLALLMLLSAAILIASCATQPDPNSSDPPGFFSGLLHGFLIFFTFIG